jgi:hypothetical protein
MNRSSKPFKVGSMVKVFWDGEKKWFKGQIIEKVTMSKKDVKWKILYTDGDVQDEMEKDLVLIQQSERKDDIKNLFWKSGMKVSVYWDGENQYYSGTITGEPVYRKNERCWRVQYDDGDSSLEKESSLNQLEIVDDADSGDSFKIFGSSKKILGSDTFCSSSEVADTTCQHCGKTFLSIPSKIYHVEHKVCQKRKRKRKISSSSSSSSSDFSTPMVEVSPEEEQNGVKEYIQKKLSPYVYHWILNHTNSYDMIKFVYSMNLEHKIQRNGNHAHRCCFSKKWYSNQGKFFFLPEFVILSF